MITTLAILCAILVMAAVQKTAHASGEIRHVRLTYYLPTGNVMYSGAYPFEGALACSWNFPLGTRLRFPDGTEGICLDRGMLGSVGWVDRFSRSHSEGRNWVDWQTLYTYQGDNYTEVEIVEE